MSELIFVTGGSGYIAAHIISQLLKAGYRVRTTARHAKATQLQDLLNALGYGDKAEVVDIPDILHATFPLEGVSAVIHTASPLPGSDATPKQIVDVAVEGSINVLRQTHAAGIRRFIYTGSIIATRNAKMTMTDQDWYTIPPGASPNDPVVAYAVGKTEGEKAIWAFADEHPELDITVFNPSFVYGPLADTFPLPLDPTQSSLSTATHIYRLLYNDSRFPSLWGYIDVRDTARLHVLALTATNPTPSRKKRFPLTSPHPITWPAVAPLIAKERPELKSRLPADPAPGTESAKAVIPPSDYARIEEVFGVPVGEFQTLESTVLDTVDSLIKMEEYWIANGHALPETTPR